MSNIVALAGLRPRRPAAPSSLQEVLGRAGMHELLPATAADQAAAVAVAFGFAGQAASGRTMLWVRQDPPRGGARPHPPGLAALGIDPARLLLVRAGDATATLRAGVEAARCTALGAVLIEPYGVPRQLDLTASRRLSLAAQAGRVFTVLLRTGPPLPSAAQTRWLVTGRPSRALEANAPGAPVFELRLLRHRGGLGEQIWHMEWDRETRSFRATPTFGSTPLSGAVVALPADRPAATGGAAVA